jgi:phosphoribosyl 1,2-cyclic phosphate phosphodiesterase
MNITILGCGGSLGVPQVGCKCYVCKAGNQHNLRSRASIFIESETTKILIDASPDVRSQALKSNITHIDAVVLTHGHSDHISGLDDLKPFYLKTKKQIPVYMNTETWNVVQSSFSYLFKDYGSKIYQPIMKENIVNNYDEIVIGDIKLQLFEQGHGEISSLGIRVNDFAYSTDLNNLPDASLPHLQGLACWVVDCLRYSLSPSHTCYEQTLEWINQLKPKDAILTHMSHEIGYEEILKLLPANIRPAYDGMVLKI